MPKASPGGPNPAASFVLRALAWGLGIFGLLKLGWFETRCLLPFTRLQGRLGAEICGTPTGPIQATLACSGADAIALCLAAILAYPAPWRTRLAGAGGGLALIVGLNVLRIGTLGRAAASPRLFGALHVYLWPAALILAIACYVFAWMRRADRRAAAKEGAARPRAGGWSWGPTRRFALLTLVLIVAFVAASPLYLESRLVLAAAVLVARAAAAIIGLAGLEAVATANVLATSQGSFVVTQECLATPLIPVYLAAVAAFSRTWRRGILGVVAAVPLFLGLGILRLLVVALPNALVRSPLVAVHAFYQFLLGAILVALAAWWINGAGRAVPKSLAGIAAGLLGGRLIGPPLAALADRAAGAAAALVAGPGASAPSADPQGAIALLPAFQVGLYLALWVAAVARVGWRRPAAGLALLWLGQVASLAALRLLAAADAAPHVRDVRAWAVAWPLIVLALVGRGRLLHRRSPDAGPGEGTAGG